MNKCLFDIIGVGTGPFNLSLAALSENSSLKNIFFDRKNEYSWHPGMQINFATIQNNSLRDLVSLAKPDSYYSFNNFLKVNSRLEQHMIARFPATYRWEFEQYLKWVIDNLSTVKLGYEIVEIEELKEGFQVTTRHDNQLVKYRTKNLSLGVGVIPNVPDNFKVKLSKNIFHNSSYKLVDPKKFESKNVIIVGAGQSGLEVSLDLLSMSTNSPSTIKLINRQPFIHQIEDSHFAEEVVFTENGLNSYFDLNSSQKKALNAKYRLTSDGASPETISALFQKVYINNFNYIESPEFTIENNSEVVEIKIRKDGSYEVVIEDVIGENKKKLDSDIIILCTGYKQHFPKEIFNEGLLEKIGLNEDDLPIINKEYQLQYSGVGNIYVVNGAKHTHGVVDPNLSLSAIRAQSIINSLSL